MKANYEFKAGLFVAIGAVLFVAVIWILGQERQIFSSSAEYFARFEDVRGLSEGAPVRLAGITVGRVSEISFPKDVNDPFIDVRLMVSSSFTERVRSNSVVSLQTQGLLGDQFIGISTAVGGSPLPAGSTIKTSEAASMGEVMEKAAVVVENTVQVSQKINEFITELRGDVLTNFSASLSSFSKIINEVESGDGLAHDIIYSKEYSEKILTSVSSVANDLKNMSHEIRNGEGLLHALIYDPRGEETIESLTVASKNLAVTAEHISSIAQEIQQGDGMLNDIIYGESTKSFDEMVSNLNDTAKNLQKASAALAEGQGTLGALLIDSQLYDNMVEVTDGAKRSFLLRQAIRSSLDK